VSGPQPSTALSAAAGIWTTATDLARLLEEELTVARGGTSPVLSADGLRQLQTTTKSSGYGLGTFISGNGKSRSTSHAGSGPDQHGLLIAFPQRGDGLVMLTNGANGREAINDVLLAQRVTPL
jgi:CubicO group peptidase (beta-lactamase class C family)